MGSGAVRSVEEAPTGYRRGMDVGRLIASGWRAAVVVPLPLALLVTIAVAGLDVVQQRPPTGQPNTQLRLILSGEPRCEGRDECGQWRQPFVLLSGDLAGGVVMRESGRDGTRV